MKIYKSTATGNILLGKVIDDHLVGVCIISDRVRNLGYYKGWSITNFTPINEEINLTIDNNIFFIYDRYLILINTEDRRRDCMVDLKNKEVILTGNVNLNMCGDKFNDNYNKIITLRSKDKIY